MLCDDSVFFVCIFAVANAGLVTVAGTITGTVALAVFAIIFAVTFVTVAFAIAAASVAVQQLASPSDNAVAIGSNNIDDTGHGSQSQNDLGNYFQIKVALR